MIERLTKLLRVSRRLFVLILAFLYINFWAWLGVLFFEDINPVLWGSQGEALLTLFRVATLEDWTDVMYELMTVYSYAWVYFLTYFLVLVVFFSLFLMRLMHRVLTNLPAAGVQAFRLDQKSLDHQVRRVWESQEFLTALSTVLPEGESDAENGLDYIPFMLHNVDERRKRYKRSSEFFLSVTVFFGFVFSMIIVSFGYILVNDDSVGINRTLVAIEGELRSAATALGSSSPRVDQNAAYSSNLQARIDQARDEVGSEFNANNPGIFEIETTDDLGKLNQKLAVWLDEEVGDEAAVDNISQLRALINSVLSEYNRSRVRFDVSLETIENRIESISRTTTTSDFRTTELLKRLAVGFVVATFFLAILRYVSLIYRDHHEQMLNAEADELAIRKFYVALKAAYGNDDLQREAITSLLAANNGPKEEPVSSISPGEASLVKEFLNIISRRVN